MTWPLAILLLIIFICLSVLIFLQFPNFSNYIEIYFLVVILILFIILIFTIDFSNPISYTITFKQTTTAQTVTLNVPHNEDTSYSNLMTATFAGLYNTTKINADPAAPANIQTFNYDTLNVGETVTLLDGKLVLKKLANWQMELDIVPNAGGNSDPINGYFNLSLLCNSSQDIEGKFEEV